MENTMNDIQLSQHFTVNLQQFQRLIDYLKAHALTDQLLTGNGWLHISWSPFAPPRHIVRVGYYK